MSRFVDLLHQVRARLPWRNGGTGNHLGYGTAVVLALVNDSDTTALPLGTLVQAANTGTVEPVAAADSEDVIGVVVGYWRSSDGQLVEDDCPASMTAAVMVRGRTKALIDADVSFGEYAYSSATPGSSYGDAALATGAWGRWASSGIVASEPLVPVTVGLIGGGGGGGGVGALGQLEAQFTAPSGGLEIPETRVPWGGIITGWTLRASAACTVEVDLWVCPFADAPPTGADSICGSALPSMTGVDRLEGSTLTGWTTTLNAGDRLIAVVYPTETDLEWVTFDLIVERTS